jgi:hypothetical protein
MLMSADRYLRLDCCFAAAVEFVVAAAASEAVDVSSRT